MRLHIKWFKIKMKEIVQPDVGTWPGTVNLEEVSKRFFRSIISIIQQSISPK